MEQAQGRHGESGYAMAALLVAIALMAVLMSVAMPVWRQANQREREAELVWRGEQYDRAIQLYRKKFSAPGPPNLDILVDQKFLRKKYKDPMTGGDFELKPVGVVGNLPTNVPQPRRAEGQLIGGVKSKSKEKSIRVLNGRNRYDQWEFTYKPYNANPAPQQPGPGRQPGLRPAGSSTRPSTTTRPSPSGGMSTPPDQ
jgi:type II secretory pathway pseudopilin PulG